MKDKQLDQEKMCRQPRQVQLLGRKWLIKASAWALLHIPQRAQLTARFCREGALWTRRCRAGLSQPYLGLKREVYSSSSPFLQMSGY